MKLYNNIRILQNRAHVNRILLNDILVTATTDPMSDHHIIVTIEAICVWYIFKWVVKVT